MNVQIESVMSYGERERQIAECLRVAHEERICARAEELYRVAIRSLASSTGEDLRDVDGSLPGSEQRDTLESLARGSFIAAEIFERVQDEHLTQAGLRWEFKP